MASSTYLPAREDELITWTRTFADAIDASATTYGLTGAQATAYDAAQTQFVQAHQAANAPTTRTPERIAQKNTKKRDMIVMTRELVAIVQAYPGTTDDMRVALGITVRDVEPTPVPVPSEMPEIKVVSALGRTLTFRVVNADTTRRGKPEGVVAALIYTWAGETPPDSPADWKFQGLKTTALCEVTFPEGVAPGTPVHVTALWVNGKMQPGPACLPVSLNLPGGFMQQVA